ncbi:MAG: hypothetical protein Pg6C_02570 [Treponemataceae bacterium]|nr:MAG: hypothetical protein Pg6C_02570 [Treponemataceae bacterium]
MRGFFSVVLAGLLTTGYVFAQSDLFFSDPYTRPVLKLDLPLFDLPYQIDAMNTVEKGFFSGYANPSMAQSMAVTTDMFSAFHYGMKQFYDTMEWDKFVKEFIYHGGVMLGYFILTYLPGGDGWLHEEFHRAVMTRFGVNSFNDMNTFPIGASMVNVNSIADEDLIRFKAESPADFIRMHEAGIEGQYLLIDRLQRNNFFYDQNFANIYIYLFDTINSHFYVAASGDPAEVDASTDAMNRQETGISSRDFTGFDMTGWVYDLFRPNDPYQNRGVHPSGTGINRYRKTTDLAKEELAYLQQQVYWHFFNYISPMLIGINKIPLGEDGVYGNFAFRHLLTSFGTDVSVNVFFKKPPFNLVFIYHNYLNYKYYFPAIEAELIDFPLSLGQLTLYLSPRLLIGMQPENQVFKTGNPEFLGLAGCRVDFEVTKYFLPYFDISAKTDGWVAGNEFLNGNVSIKAGVSARF